MCLTSSILLRSRALRAILCRNASTVDKAEVTCDGFDLHLLTEGPKTNVNLTRQDALTMFKHMVDIRHMEVVCAEAYMDKIIRGFLHICVGQESCNVGVFMAMDPEDDLITAYRCHGYAYLLNGSIHGVIAEVMGRETGMAKGKGGSMHIWSPPHFYGGNGIVGGQVPMGSGAAFAAKYRNKKSIVFTLYGDGAANQGQVYESFNICKLWNLPNVFICENNKFGLGTHVHRASAITSFHNRCVFIPGIRTNGMDVLSVRQAVKFAADHVRSGNGPFVLELQTYRYYGHSLADPGTTYRTREEIENVRKNHDCINNFAKKIIENKLVTAEELNKIKKISKEEIWKMGKQARAEKEPSLSELGTDVYVKYIEKFVRNTDGSNLYKEKKLDPGFVFPQVLKQDPEKFL